ncbi:bifunctional phosphoribosylaminoimidazolecarboxamide formyltransferase/IMP cyclohydrolase [Youngiibacter multivorans]|uniref:Bifunctional purine biosynthesis protein PurH n=1 Tax=Youngiibacter multivorans TaxID=937251 RepID=A0ABS4G6Z9_9CLOT|nr:bifunctional phosphoribosylaminoimidazolecarboxamide formyltransferase/IMP cyclohydrolase [Youngiibacter multivorans]MBP1920340.1 phosphoribosylaminoimidazolecarboxamide formyltransferase/IMP cyclohydrolase [Youngiibacter multivorans]
MRALISVFDKTGLKELALFLEKNGVEIISSGGTYKYLQAEGIKVSTVESVTGFPEILDGRVKTLHPSIHSGILYIRENESHARQVKELGIEGIDIVCVNLYPFFDKLKENLPEEEQIEFIDIGGPTMLRAAAKNFRDVYVLSDPGDYEGFISGFSSMESDRYGESAVSFKKHLAGKVFSLMGAYDSAVATYILGGSFNEYLNLSYRKVKDLRYGENPHQKAAYYESLTAPGALKDMEILWGKELSYNNLKDMDIAWKSVCEFEEDACCAVKHNTPCGFALGNGSFDAYRKAYECDTVSIFGGIVALNCQVTKEAAEMMNNIFLEVVMAPSFTDEALEILKKKKNLRIVRLEAKPSQIASAVTLDGLILTQDEDLDFVKEMKVVTEKVPTKEEMDELVFAMRVVKYVKSNAIVVSRDRMAVGIGGGQVNRIDAAKFALSRGEGATVMASDAFFPFGDVVEEAGKYGIKAIIQPGGSLKDQESIDKCNELGISMVFTSMRHFKH